MSRPIPLLFILDEFPGPHAGTEGQFWLLFRNLDRARVTPSILLLRRSEFLEQQVAPGELRVLGVHSLRAPRSIAKLLGAVWWARRAGFRLAHIFFNDSTIVFPLPLKLLGIRVIVSRRDTGFWYTPRNLPLLRLAARAVDRVVANCEAVRTAVVKAERFAPARVEVIYNGLVRPADAATALRRDQFGIPDDAHVIVIVANLRPLKRIGDAVAVLARLQREVGETHLLVVGEDRANAAGESHRVELERQAAQLTVAGKLHFAGLMRDPMPAVALADVCMLCSETEGLSNTIIEYMLAGKPVICSAVGGNPELVAEGETGYLAATGDIDAMVRSAVRLLADRQLALAFGSRGRERALREFTAQSMVQKQTELYERLV